MSSHDVMLLTSFLSNMVTLFLHSCACRLEFDQSQEEAKLRGQWQPGIVQQFYCGILRASTGEVCLCVCKIMAPSTLTTLTHTSVIIVCFYAAAKAAGFLKREDVAIWRTCLEPTDLPTLGPGMRDMMDNWPLKQAEELFQQANKVCLLASMPACLHKLPA